MIFFTSDLHFNHSRIIEYCKRPFKDVDEMNSELLYRWNFVVRSQDTVILAGDIAFGKKGLEFVSNLNGEIILIRGNHDYGFSKSKLLSTGIVDVLKNKKLVLYLPGFPRINVGHYPKKAMPGLNLCGHVHDRWLMNEEFFNVGVDQHDFAPLSLTELKLFDIKIVR